MPQASQFKRLEQLTIQMQFILNMQQLIFGVNSMLLTTHTLLLTLQLIQFSFPMQLSKTSLIYGKPKVKDLNATPLDAIHLYFVQKWVLSQTLSLASDNNSILFHLLTSYLMLTQDAMQLLESIPSAILQYWASHSSMDSLLSLILHSHQLLLLKLLTHFLISNDLVYYSRKLLLCFC